MARRPPTGTSDSAASPVRTEAQLQRALRRLDERIGELQAFDVEVVTKGTSPQLLALEAAIQDTIARAFGENTIAAQRFSDAARLQLRPMGFSDSYPQRHHYQEAAQRNVERALALLTEAKRAVAEDLEELAETTTPPTAQKPGDRDRVFIVHGHDEAALQSLARFLEHLGLEAIILKEQPDQGRTIIEKFEDSASRVGFAVVLLTPDDVGGAQAGASQSRARQNVIFELGYFAGKLGRGRACLLKKGDVEIPSDLYGVIYTELDAADGWKLKLGRELKASGYHVDLNDCA